MFDRLNIEKKTRFDVDSEMMKTVQYKFKEGDRVSYFKDESKTILVKAIIAECGGYVQGGKKVYNVHPPGKKNSRGCWIWVAEDELTARK